MKQANNSFYIFYITHERKTDAEEFVNQCLEDRWIACGNIFPIDSAYHWKGDVAIEGEFVSIVKTSRKLVEPFLKYAERIHPFEVPCLLHWEVQANRSYVDWIEEEVRDDI